MRKTDHVDDDHNDDDRSSRNDHSLRLLPSPKKSLGSYMYSKCTHEYGRKKYASERMRGRERRE